MRRRCDLFVLTRFAMVLLVSVLCKSTDGQLRGGLGGTRGGGARIGTGGARSSASPRSGLGIRSNPIANPAPSLTPHQVLNPRGSLSTGQVLNPAPSLRRPRSGTLPATKSSSTPMGTKSRPASGTAITAQPPLPTSSPFQQLARELQSYKNGEAWVKHLVPTQTPTANHHASVSSEQTEKLLKRFDRLTGNPAYQKVTSLPGFNPSHEALKAIVAKKP